MLASLSVKAEHLELVSDLTTFSLPQEVHLTSGKTNPTVE